jgi:hypothetical protein
MQLQYSMREAKWSGWRERERERARGMEVGVVVGELTYLCSKV